jgi:hypothetical protein
MCVCIQCFWEWLVEHLKKKPIIRYEQVPFDIDDHVEEELAQETVQLLTPDTECGCSEQDDTANLVGRNTKKTRDKTLTQPVSAELNAVSIELTTNSQMTLTPYVTADSTDSSESNNVSDDSSDSSVSSGSSNSSASSTETNSNSETETNSNSETETNSNSVINSYSNSEIILFG